MLAEHRVSTLKDIAAFGEGQEKHAGNLEQNLKQIRIQQKLLSFQDINGPR